MFGPKSCGKLYLQSTTKLLRGAYLKPNCQLKFLAGYFLKLLRPLYGLTGWVDYRQAKFAQHLTYGLECKLRPAMCLYSLGARVGKVLEYFYPMLTTQIAYYKRSFFELNEQAREAFEVKSREHNKNAFLSNLRQYAKR